MIGKLLLGLTSAHQTIAVEAMDYIDLVPTISQGVGEAMQIDGIAAEAVWWIKNRKKTESKRPRHFAQPLQKPRAVAVPSFARIAGSPRSALLLACACAGLCP